jgi:hypothetical protein
MLARLSVLAALPLLALAGCSLSIGAGLDAEATETEALAAQPIADDFTLDGPHHYVYYPEAEVYYAPDRDVYFWRGANFWGVGSDLPSTIELDRVGREIDLDTRKPYRVHPDVVAVFQREAVTGADDDFFDEAVAVEPDAEAPF